MGWENKATWVVVGNDLRPLLQKFAVGNFHVVVRQRPTRLSSKNGSACACCERPEAKGVTVCALHDKPEFQRGDIRQSVGTTSK